MLHFAFDELHSLIHTFLFFILEIAIPTFSFCPNNKTVPTDPGKAYATVNWTVPTATDWNGTELTVDILPPGSEPPVKLAIERHYLQISATDKYGFYAHCNFYITVKG